MYDDVNRFNTNKNSGVKFNKYNDHTTNFDHEVADVPFSKLRTGIELLVSGTNPVIRFRGTEGYIDYKLSASDIEHLREGLRLDDLLKSLDYRL